MERREVVVVGESQERLVALATALEAGGRLVATSLADPGSLPARVASRPPAALVVELGEKADLFLDAVESLPMPRPPFVALGAEDESRTVLRTLRLGARHYLPLDAGAEKVVAALKELGLLDEPGAASGGVVAVLGAKGGVGATLVATQLALTLQRMGSPATLADLDLRQGDASLYLDLQPAHSLADLSHREGRLDGTWLETVLQAHPSGVRLLAAPPQPEDAELVVSERVTEAIEIARELASWTLLDLAGDFGDVSLRALDLSDEVLLVTTTEIPSLHHAHAVLSLLERLGLPGSRVHVVVNRVGGDDPVGLREVREFLGRPCDARLPDDAAASREIVNYGRALADAAPRSPLGSALEELAARLHEWRGLARPPAAPPAGRLDAAQRWLRNRLHGAD